MRRGIAIWTLGEHARRNIVPGVQASSSWSLRGATTRDRTILDDVARATSTIPYEDPAEMLADPGVEAVILAGPNGVHFSQARAVLEAGKHVFVEKSLTPTLGQARLLSEMAKDRGCVIAECFMYRFHEQFAAVRRLLSPGGPLGRIQTIHARFGFPHLAPSDIRYSAELAGGALMDVGAYCLSALDLLCEGEIDIRAAGLQTEAGYSVDTSGFLAGRSGSVTLLADWSFGASYRNELEIWGSDASLLVPRAFSKPPTLQTSLSLRHQLGNREEGIEISPDNAFAAMLDEFAAAIGSSEKRSNLRADLLRQAHLMERVREIAAQS